MKKKIFYAGAFCFLLTLSLVLAFGLAGCGYSVPTESPYYGTSGNATSGNATDGNAVQTVGMTGSAPTLTPMPTLAPAPTTNPVVENTPVTVDTGEPEKTAEPVERPEVLSTPEPTPPPQSAGAALVPPEYTGTGEYKGLSAILGAINDYYTLHSDPAVGAKYAAQLVDWYVESGRSQADVYMGVLGWLDRVGVFSAEEMTSFFRDGNYISKLDSVYAIAVTLCGEEGKALLDAGSYVPAGYPYAMTDIDAVFSLVYNAFGEIKPQSVRLYQGDDYVGVVTADSGTLTPMTLVKALVSADVLTPEVQVLGWEETDGVLTVDFNEAFLTQLKELEPEREDELIRTLVNIIHENLGAEMMLFTLEGETLETEHAVYDQPLER